MHQESEETRMEHIAAIKESDKHETKYLQEDKVSSSDVIFDAVDSSEKSTVNNTSKINQGTSTDAEEDNNLISECKYCKARLSKLLLLERLKAKKALHLSRFSLKSLLKKKHMCRNKACQTSAGLFQSAIMTERERKNIAMILRFRNVKPKKNEAFCKCVLHGREKDCTCGENDKYFDWVWDSCNRARATELLEDDRLVIFHKNFSCGTSAVCGKQAMSSDQHFWEIKMTSSVYGTDMMIGVGTLAVDLDSYSNIFCSLLGFDVESWGISYDGRIQHDGQKQDFCSRFGQGAIIGVHLDMWHGTLSFFKNRQALGIAYNGLKGRTLYPMACSTAARSGMKIISSSSFPSSLQFMCCQKLRQCVPAHLDVIEAVSMPPGLKKYLANNIQWLLQPQKRFSSNSICSVCLPMRSVLEGLSDYEESEEEEHSDLHILVPSDDEESYDEDEENDISDSDASSFQTDFLTDYGEGTSSQLDDAFRDLDKYTPSYKRLKCESGQIQIRLRSEEYTNDTDTESDDKPNDLFDSEMKRQSADILQKRLYRKRKR